MIRIIGEDNAYIKRLRDHVKKFVDKINDDTILLKDINANFINRRTYLERMIKVVEKLFDFNTKDARL